MGPPFPIEQKAPIKSAISSSSPAISLAGEIGKSWYFSEAEKDYDELQPRYYPSDFAEIDEEETESDMPQRGWGSFCSELRRVAMFFAYYPAYEANDCFGVDEVQMGLWTINKDQFKNE